ncbi:ROK family protein [Synechococcus sp. CCY9201]|nr:MULTISPECIES: ROK family protein [unclassified Synechococcus]MEA5423049.1 ROK family protein [Synechococcus sp. CCY9202]MEA5473071.1 ROK family protein [Synechococcus sp. CCY9201]CAK6695663.1 Glucokinase [Synechococcus sp. CBW1107]
MAAMAQLIGIDVGGTAIKLGRFDQDGHCLAEAEVATPQPAMPGAVTMAIAEAVETIDPQRLAPWVGIGHPGPSDQAGRVARIAINLPGWQDVPLATWLEPMLERRITLANDANCAALGELRFGAARGCRDVVLLTLGTGVGGAVILQGNLFLGHRGAAAEPGLICLDPDGPECNSGNRGSLEQHCSISGLQRLSPLSPQELCQRADGGDAAAIEVWSAYGRLLGVGITSLLYLFTPERVLIGGGLSGACHHFLPAVWEEVTRRVLPVSREGLDIRPCELGNGAGRLGAALLALERLSAGESGTTLIGAAEVDTMEVDGAAADGLG